MEHSAWQFQPGRYAAIDIGTVTCRLFVADVDKAGHFTEVVRERAITNLGEGVDATGLLKPEAMQRVAQAVRGFMQTVHSLGKVKVTATATSAARDAANGEDFIALLKNEGVALHIIPGEREAALSFAGASCDFSGEDLMVVDVGGGSTEVVFGTAGEGPVKFHSFNVGCRRVTEKFLHSDPYTEEGLEEARAWIRHEFEAFFAKAQQEGLRPQRMVAVAGTATTVVSMHEAMEAYDPKRVHGYVVSRKVLDNTFDTLSKLPLAERKRLIGLDPGRAPVITAGMIILQEIMNLSGKTEFTVSETDILHGIIFAAARKGSENISGT